MMRSGPLASWLTLLLCSVVCAQVPSHLAPATDVRGHAYDSNRGVLYISTADGLKRWDSEARTFLPQWLEGRNLRGIDLTVDGAALLVCDAQPAGNVGTVYRIDLNTAQVTNLSFPLQSFEGGAYDVVALANDRAFVTTSNGSFGPLREISLATNTVTVRPFPGGIGNQVGDLTQVCRSADGSLALFVGSNSSSGPVSTYAAGTNSFPSSRNFNTFFFNSVAAVSRDGQRIAIEDGGGLRLVTQTLANSSFIPNAAYGVAFDPVRDRLYTPQQVGSSIEVRDANTRTILSTFPAGEAVAVTQPQGLGEMSIAADGSYLALTTTSGVRLYRIGLPRPIVDAVVPPQAHWDQGVVRVTVQGRFFDVAPGTPVTVRIGGLPATAVEVVDGQTLRCSAPSDGPGPKDVEVQFAGQPGRRAGAFARTPALTLGGTPQIGGIAALRTQLRTGDWLLGCFSLGAAVPSTVPGLQGTLWLGNATPWYSMPAWPLPEFTLTTAIPNLPGLVGLQLVFQSITGNGTSLPVVSNPVELIL